MSAIFSASRGSFFIQRDMSFSASMIYIPGMDTMSLDNTLVSNFSFNDSEKNAIIQCFNDVNHVYAFGHDPEQSGFSITYITFLGDRCMENGFKPGWSLADIVDSYNDIKLSKKESTVIITFGHGVSLEGIILSLSVSVYETELNAITVTITGKSMKLGR